MAYLLGGGDVLGGGVHVGGRREDGACRALSGGEGAFDVPGVVGGGFGRGPVQVGVESRLPVEAVAEE
ncbi:hypothetical protein [Streptomyces tendae]